MVLKPKDYSSGIFTGKNYVHNPKILMPLNNLSFSLYTKITIKKIKPKEKCKRSAYYRMLLTSNPLLILTCSLCWSPNK